MSGAKMDSCWSTTLSFEPAPVRCWLCRTEIARGTIYSVNQAYWMGHHVSTIGMSGGSSFLFCGLACLKAWAAAWDKIVPAAPTE